MAYIRNYLIPAYTQSNVIHTPTDIKFLGVSEDGGQISINYITEIDSPNDYYDIQVLGAGDYIGDPEIIDSGEFLGSVTILGNTLFVYGRLRL